MQRRMRTSLTIAWIVMTIAVIATEASMADESIGPIHYGHLTVDQYQAPPPTPRTLASNHPAKIHQRASVARSSWLASDPAGRKNSPSVAVYSRDTDDETRERSRLLKNLLGLNGGLDRSDDEENSYVDKGPGSVETYTLNLLEEERPLPGGDGLTRRKAVNTVRIGWKKAHQLSGESNERLESGWLPPRDLAFGNGQVPELQTGCEGLEDYGGARSKRSDDTGRTANYSVRILAEGEDSLDEADDDVDDDDEESDELLRLKKLFRIMQGPRRGDMQITVDPYSSLSVDHLPDRGDLGKSSRANVEPIAEGNATAGDASSSERWSSRKDIPSLLPESQVSFKHRGRTAGDGRSARSVLAGRNHFRNDNVRGALDRGDEDERVEASEGGGGSNDRRQRANRGKYREDSAGRMYERVRGPIYKDERRGVGARERMHLSFADREAAENVATRRPSEIRRRALEEEKKLREYIRRNQPVAIPPRPTHYYQPNQRNALEARKRLDAVRQYDRSSGRGEHGPSAPTDVHWGYPEDDKSRNGQHAAATGARFEAEGLRGAVRRAHESANLGKEALRREEEYRREKSRKYEEERRRQELARLAEEGRQTRPGNVWDVADGSTTVRDRAAYHTDTDSRRLRERERLLEQREGEGRRGGDSATALSWQRREEARLNALPVSARIIIEPRRYTPVTVPSRTGPSWGVSENRRGGAEGARYPTSGPPPPPPSPPRTTGSPSPCVWAIVQCCPLNNYRLVTCFESMGCPGANWTPNPCSGAIAHAARTELTSFYAKDDTRRIF